MEIFKIVGVGILTCIVAVIIKQIKPEFFILVVLAGSIIVLLLVADRLKSLIDYIITIFSKTRLDYSLFSSILKIIGVGYLTEFASSICNDSGNTSVGEKIIFAGKVVILCLSLPIITSLLDTIIELLP